MVNSTYAKCFCKNGFISFDNFSTCEDIDDCSTGSNSCNFENSICINTKGSFKCSCNTGWALNSIQTSCDDVNECQNHCKMPNATCTNLNGTYQCQCNTNGSFYNADSDSCEDVDECKDGQQHCDPVRGICQNEDIFKTNKRFNCTCPNGWELSTDGSNICKDINECLICNGQNSRCQNTPGSFDCSCAAGFVLNATNQCQFVDLCSKNSYCPANATCSINSLGIPVCTCNQGYTMNHLSICIEIDECQSETAICVKPHQACQNIVGGPGIRCECRDGFQKVGEDCIEKAVNVCSSNPLICLSNQQCFDTNSSIECRCYPGYVKNELDLCEDLDECLIKGICPENADCINRNGSYDCQCKTGYTEKNATAPNLKLCYQKSVWSPWEQVGPCSELCQTDQKQGKMLFVRRCEGLGPYCEGETKREIVCNAEFCDNKLKVSKSLQCEKWENTEKNIDLTFKVDNQTWFKELRTWLNFHVNASGCTTINWVNIDAGLKDRLKNLQLVISLLIDIRSSLRRVIDCNSYLQRTNDLFQNYRSVQSKLVMYTSIKAAFKKLQARLDLKQNDCKYSLFGPYSSYVDSRFVDNFVY